MSVTQKGYVGTRALRAEDLRFVTGRGRYVDDVPVPEALSLAFVRSIHAHAEIVEVDTEDARRRRDLVAVLTGSDVVGLCRPMSNDRLPFVKQAPWYPLAADRVRFAGEPVVAVVAADRYRAEDLAELVSVEYRPLPAVVDLEGAARADAPLLYEGWGDNIMTEEVAGPPDMDGLFASADVVISERLRSQRYTGVPLEPRGCVASFEAGSLTLWSSTQWPFMLRTVLAEWLQLPESRFRVIAPDVGGGFGIKQAVAREEVLVCLLAMQLGRPVKWIEDRAEHLVASVHAREQIHDIEVAASRDGRILAMRDRMLADMGSGAQHFPGVAPAFVTATFIPGPYDFQNYLFDIKCVVTNRTPTGAYRGFGMTEATFVMERAIDFVARELRIDPLDVRRRNLVRPEQLPYRMATGSMLDSGDYPATLERAVELADLPSFRAEQASALAEQRYIGIGIIDFVEGSGPTAFPTIGRGGAYERALVRVEPDGTTMVFTGLASQGQSHETSMAQVAADALGVPLDTVAVRGGDTEGTIFGLGAWGGRGASVGAPAVHLAAMNVHDKVVRIAAHLLEAPPESLEISEGHVSVREDPDRAVSFADVAEVAYHQTFRLPPGEEPGLDAIGTFDPPNIDHVPDASGLMNVCVTYSNAAHVAVVEVDPRLGTVRVLRYLVVEDCGRMINPMVVDGQIRGGLAQGIGGALLEELVYDENGQLLTTGFMDYLVPTAVDMPRVEIDHLETPALYVPGGFKGMGEGGAVGPPAAIASAVEDALAPFGVRVTETPLSPVRILDLLAAANPGPIDGVR